MADLSIKEIADYNNRNAFTRVRSQSARTAATFMKSVDQINTRGVQTNNLSESYSLVAGLSSRLEMIRENLSTMLGYAELGASATNSQDRDEAIGYLRSLSGGIDDIVDQTKWNDTRTLDGRTIDISLSSNGSGTSRKIELDSMYTSDETGLDLTAQPSSSVSSIYYDYYAALRNQDAGVVGLDLTEAVPGKVDPTLNELETDTYRIEISYAGPDSSISIKTLEGGLVNTVDNVDLSGTGQELVDMGVGVKFSIAKEKLLESVDKYDYENEGPATLYALMDYERVFQHELSGEGFDHFTDRALDVSYKSQISDGTGGSLEIENIEMAGIGYSDAGFPSGSYTMRVKYGGERSTVEVRDGAGRLQYLNYKVDLSGEEKVEIDTGKGLSFTIDNQNFSGESGQMMAFFEYKAEENNNENFDFNEYARKIQKAIQSLDEDWETVLVAQNEILKVNSYQNGSAFAQGAGGSGAMIASILGSSMSSEASSIFNAGNANASLSAAANEIFSGIGSAVSAQGGLIAARSVV